MKTNEQVKDWLKELKAERRDLVTKQMAYGNTGAINALKWVLAGTRSEEEVRLKLNEVQVSANEAITDELASVAYGAMAEALRWVLRAD